MKRLLGLAVLAAAAAAFLVDRPARACGGCFHGPPQSTETESVVTDHRMVFSVSKTQTVLWDQIRYTGEPGEFAWVLPVREGARVELSHDAFIAALDASTQPVVLSPQYTCPPVSSSGGLSFSGGSYGGGGGGGGGCFGSASSASYSPAAGSEYSEDGGASNDASAGVDAGFQGNDVVSVESQDVIGPYETVTLRAKDGQGLDTWLVANGFEVPPALVPTINAYQQQGFDFIALKLRPGAGIRAMQPVRVVTPGADPTLPLRMVAAGIGANVGITLWVIGEGRWHTQNFPDAPLDWSKLTWNATAGRSNYQELLSATMAAGDGRGFVTEYTAAPNLGYGSNSSYNPGLHDAYMSVCATLPPEKIPCAVDAGPTPPDAGSPDAGDQDAEADAGPLDAAADADAAPAPPDAGECFTYRDACDGFDDIEVATSGMTASDVRVTRLRAYLPAGALSADLLLEAAPEQSSLSNVHVTTKWSDPSYDPCPKSTPPRSTSTNPPPPSSDDSSGCVCATPSRRGTDAGTYAILLAAAALGLKIVRRARR